MEMLDKVLQRIDDDLNASLDRLFALLRIESISTDPAYNESCRAAADWLANELDSLGFDADARASLEWGVTGVPETFIIDADGTIAYTHTGPITPDILERKILPKLREVAGG